MTPPAATAPATSSAGAARRHGVVPYRYRGLRWSPEMGFEARCDSCAERGVSAYWPITLEFWNPVHGLRRCRACVAEADRLRHRAIRARNPREVRKERDRARYLANRDFFLLKQRERDARRRAERAA